MRKLLFSLYALAVLQSCNNSSDAINNSFKTITVNYPVSYKDSSIRDNYFGTMVPDPYRWLENDTSPQTTNWVKAQNSVTQGYLKESNLYITTKNFQPRPVKENSIIFLKIQVYKIRV
jgi:prolyl oligopeptidase